MLYISKKKKNNTTKKKPCEELMWRDAGELYAHAIQVEKKKKKKKYNATQYGMWVYLGKGKCMYFTFMQKKSIQIKYVNISPCMK